MSDDDTEGAEVVPPLAGRTVSPEAFTAIERAVGQVIVSFAMLDMALDFWLLETFPRAVHRNVASKMPYQLGHKLKTLRDNLRASA